MEGDNGLILVNFTEIHPCKLHCLHFQPQHCKGPGQVKYPHTMPRQPKDARERDENDCVPEIWKLRRQMGLRNFLLGTMKPEYFIWKW